MDLSALMSAAEKKAAAQFEHIDRVAFKNTEKVLDAFSEYRVSDSMFAGTTGYGYDDIGRDTLEKIYAKVFGAEAALVRLNIVNGSHAIACAMLSCLSCGDTLLSVTGAPYDTLQTLIGLRGKIGGTFPEYGIGYKQVDLKNGEPDIPAIIENAKDASAVFIQRSRGYGIRRTLSCAEIGEIVQAVRSVNPTAPVIVDNCYGEFCEEQEPLAYGADLICGSLIKNPCGGLAPSGGYVAGRADLVERAAFRLTLPGIGGECGATFGQNRLLFQGFFLAPHTTAQALKTAVFCAAAMEELGYDVSPASCERRYDIIQTINFGAPEPLLAFCRGVQEGAPVDSFATPEPWPMPGYDCPVVMAAGAFIQGSSIELSCDAPMREPYTAYMQGGLTYESGKLGILKAVNRLLELK
ncbi:MAG: methionine gamma-lyase family protein [Clostridia bacterium]|nr:methionine gamma-lyase family protein [Clostridia bacterium]